MDEKGIANSYKGLDRLLYIVRWSQHLLSIIAEVLILLSFAMSGMDVSLGGGMAGIPLLKVLWAGMFALGIDTAFALSWVRVRQHLIRREWLAFTWNLLLALSMSFIIFEPIAIQLLQQSLSLNFNQAVASLGINIVFLTYARSGVAVFLGAILAMTNIETEIQAMKWTQPKQQFIRIDQLFKDKEPVIEDTPPTQEIATPVHEADTPIEAPVPAEGPITEQVAEPEQPIELPAQPDLPTYDTPEQRAQKVSELDLTGLSAPERVAKVLELFPDLSDRELGKLSGMAAATAKKHRDTLKHDKSGG